MARHHNTNDCETINLSKFSSQKSRDGAHRQKAHGRRFGNVCNGCIQRQHIAGGGAAHEDLECIPGVDGDILLAEAVVAASDERFDGVTVEQQRPRVVSVAILAE